jgi:hypothetical protein
MMQSAPRAQIPTSDQNVATVFATIVAKEALFVD